MENQYLAAIFARGGSKGLPGKNIKLFNGKPLIAWAIQNALAVDGISKVIVSTDCEKIADIAVKFNTKGKPNRQSKNITLSTNTALGKEVLKLSGMVIPTTKK